MVKQVVTLGEIMLRLKSPGFERLFQSPMLEATFGGSESNVSISMCNYKIPSKFITTLPKNAVGEAAFKYLSSFGIDTSCIAWKGDRLGIYYYENGSGPRASTVLYDRSNSSINIVTKDDFDWKKVFSDAEWFHLSGITPALSQNAANLSIHAVRTAKEHGLMVSCDLNYRKKLWNYGKKAPEIMNSLMPYVDVAIANEEDIQLSLGLTIDQKITGDKLDREKYIHLAKSVLNKYSNVKFVVISLRESHSADDNDWSGMLYARDTDQSYFSRIYHLTDIVDRVGAGDSFGAGIIYGLMTKMDYQKCIEFAVAASALKHTIPGDSNRVTVEEVQNLMKGEQSGRVQR
jgi:2-dehydro-3-deoxygluconokinase